MKKRSDYGAADISNKRMLNMHEATFYTGMGYTNCRKWLEGIGAIRHFGKRIMADRHVIDNALDNMAGDARTS